MTNAEKKLYLDSVLAERWNYMCSHPDEMLSVDRLELATHIFAMKLALKFVRKVKGNRWITNYVFWRS